MTAPSTSGEDPLAPDGEDPSGVDAGCPLFPEELLADEPRVGLFLRTMVVGAKMVLLGESCSSPPRSLSVLEG